MTNSEEVTGKETILYVDLSSEEVWRESLSRDELARYLGGRGVAARLLWDQVGPETNPLDEDNLLIFAPGSLTGTHAPNSGRMTISAKGSATNLYLKSNVGGAFGTSLKMTGNDYLAVKGAAEKPVYIHIDNEEVTIRDGSELWGKGVRETTRRLERDYGEETQVACIGPAGENLVNFAAIMVSYYNAAARGGIGAVMGSKNLKAVVADRGSGRVEVDSPEEYGKVVEESREALVQDSINPDLHKYGTARDVDMLNELNILPSYNFKKGHVEDAEGLSGRSWPETGHLKSAVGCSSCIYSCHRHTEVEEGKYEGSYSGGPEYETVASLGSGCGVTDNEAVFRANELCNDLGLDTISTGVVIQWAMETYEKGLIDKDRSDGIRLEFGNDDALVAIIERIAHREGIGDLLARGTKIASEEIGNGSEKWAVQSRGLEQSGVETRGAYSYALAFAVNPRGPDHLHTECLAEFGGTPEAVDTVKKITGDEKYATPVTKEKRAEIVRWHEDIYAVTDALGLCAFTTTAAYGIDEEKAAKMFEYKTGIETTPEEIMQAGKRIVTLERSFNVREGLSRKDDVLPRRMMEENAGDLEGEEPRISREKLDYMLDRYYELHGWDPEDGKPTGETLEDLELGFVSAEI